MTYTQGTFAIADSALFGWNYPWSIRLSLAVSANHIWRMTIKRETTMKGVSRKGSRTKYSGSIRYLILEGLPWKRSVNGVRRVYTPARPARAKKAESTGQLSTAASTFSSQLGARSAYLNYAWGRCKHFEVCDFMVDQMTGMYVELRETRQLRPRTEPRLEPRIERFGSGIFPQYSFVNQPI